MMEAARAPEAFSGLPPVPASIVWDGKTDAGAVVEGTYTAQLDVAYAKGNKPCGRLGGVPALRDHPAKVTLDADPLPFSPDGDGYNDMLTMTATATDPSPLDSWDITVTDPAGTSSRTSSGKGAPRPPFTWDGLSANGELVQSAEDYTMKVTVKDALGNTAARRRRCPSMCW